MIDILITPISKENIHSASQLADGVFDDEDILPSAGLTASYDKDAFNSLNKKRSGRFNWFKYWIALNRNNDRTVGTVGIYEERIDAVDACWLGWFCVDPEYRGHDIGKRLLLFAIEEAKKINKKYLRVFTSNRPRSLVARDMYQKAGFKPIENPQLNLGEGTIYLELKL